MRTSECLSRQQLIAVVTDDAPPSLRAHVAMCGDCRRRLTVVEGDLGLIAAALRADAGVAMPAAPRRYRRWAPAIAVAAAAVLIAFGIGVRARAPVPVPSSTGDSRAFLQAISGALFAARGYDHVLDTAPPADAEEPCGWGSLAMPCGAAAWLTADAGDAR